MPLSPDAPPAETASAEAAFLAAGYAIVDIETTGGSLTEGGITEVAIILHDGHSITGRYETLINPGQDIPLPVQRLTGISNAMVRNSPTFGDVAEEIYALLSSRIFVAHNVDFDYSFLKHHLRLAGYDLETPRLCTVRISRRIKPGLKSYGLGKLCAALGIPLTDRHRAGGDADATAILFSKMLGWDTKGIIAAFVRANFTQTKLPPALPHDTLAAIPTGPGVYHFRDKTGTVLYVGKSLNLQKGVKYRLGHLPRSARLPDLFSRISSVSWESCPTDLTASLLEFAEIQVHRPPYNRPVSTRGETALYTYENSEGFRYLAIGKMSAGYDHHLTFDSADEAPILLRRLISRFNLAPSLCSPELVPPLPLHAAYAGGDPSPEAYNRRVDDALAFARTSRPSFAILDRGRTAGEKSCIWVENGAVIAMGYLDLQSDLTDPEDIRRSLSPYPDNVPARRMVAEYAKKYPARIRYWKQEPASIRE